MKSVRPYQMKARAASAEATRERIVDAAASLMKTRFRSEIRLGEIAAAAGVSAQTVLNNFGSREALLELALREVIKRIGAVRRRAEPGDMEGAISALYEHYDNIGDWVVRNLIEEADPELLAIGRMRHREWVEIYFGPVLDTFTEAERSKRADAIIACCDVYTWRLLRNDMGRSRSEAEAVVLLTVNAILGKG